MMDFLEFLKQYGTALVLVGQIVLTFAMLYLKGQFAPISVQKEVAGISVDVKERFHHIDKRITTIEVELRAIPSRDDFHNIEKMIEQVRGDIKRLDENIDGTEGLFARLEKQVDRMEDFLKRGGQV